MAQKVEIGAQVRLLDSLSVETLIASRWPICSGLSLRFASFEFCRINKHIELPFIGVEFDQVAVANQAERPADCRLRRDVKDNGPERGATHPSVRNAHHVLDPNQFLRDREIARFWHTGSANGTRVL